MIRIRQLVLTTACFMAASTTASLRGQGILDQQLGPKAAEAQPSPPAKDASATPPKPAPDAAEPMNPDAAKKVDDADLVNKLTHPTGDGPSAAPSGAAEKAKDMVQRMDQSQTKLKQRDPGPVTQETQRRILTDLDVLIEIARKQEQQQSGSGQGPPTQQPGQSRQQEQGPHNEGGSTAAQQSVLPGGGVSSASSNETDMHQRGPEEWGKLPPRDRDLVSHGANEEFLPAYREMIDGYYKALSEMGKKH